jgi:hypothetical protein
MSRKQNNHNNKTGKNKNNTKTTYTSKLHKQKIGPMTGPHTQHGPQTNNPKIQQKTKTQKQ